MKHFLITIITVMTLVGCGGAEERKAAYLEKARLSMEAGDLDKARVELKNVLQIDPKDAQAYFQLGDIFDQKKEYRKAFRNYSKASELAPDNLEYHAVIGTYHLVLAGDIDTAIEKKDFILSKDASNLSGLLLKASILYKQKDVTGAKKVTQAIFSKQPEHVQNAIFLSSIYLNEKKFEDAINVLSACKKENHADRALLNALAIAYFKSGKNDLAENEYQGILEKNPGMFSNYLKLALFYKQIGSLDKAESILRKAIEEDADDANRKVWLVDFIQHTKGDQKAIEELKILIGNNKDLGDLRLSLAKIYLASKNIEDAKKILKTAVADFPEDSVGIKSRVYLAGLYMLEKDINAATSIINDAVEISPNDSGVNFVKAKLQLENNDNEGAIISLRIVVKDDPENIEAYLLLSSAHNANGEKEQASEIIFRAYEVNRNNAKGLIALARYHDKNKNNTELEKIIDKYLIINADDYEALSLKSKVLNEREMFSEVKPYVLRLIELYPNFPNGYVQSVPYMLSENKSDKAINLLEDGYKIVNENRPILEPLVTLYAYAKKYDVAIRKIQLAIEEHTDAVELYALLAKIQIASGDVSGARLNLSKSGLEGELRLSLEIAQLYEGLGDHDSAIDEYERAYEKNRNSVVLINNIAALLSLHRSDEKSLSRAKDLADKLKNIDQAVTLDTVGWVYYKVGDYAEAVNVLHTVVEKEPDVAVYNYHLGMALYKTGDKASAKHYLTKSLANKSSFLGKDDAETHLKKLQ